MINDMTIVPMGLMVKERRWMFLCVLKLDMLGLMLDALIARMIVAIGVGKFVSYLQLHS